jgi:steroid delta-isomerase-like uncharacterized protein
MDTDTVSKETRGEAPPGAGEFVERFASAWATSDLEALMALLADDVVLIQPMMPATVGKAQSREEFSRLFALIPDLHATVHRWAARGQVVFIEFTLTGTLGGRELSWPAVDRFLIRDGLAAERVSYFDPLPLGVHALRRPRAWGRLLRARFRPSFAATSSREVL